MEKSIQRAEYQRLCAALGRLRRHAGLSQRELAARVEVSQTFVSEVERGVRRLDLLELRDLLQAIGSRQAAAAVAVLDTLAAVLDAVAGDER